MKTKPTTNLWTAHRLTFSRCEGDSPLIRFEFNAISNTPNHWQKVMDLRHRISSIYTLIRWYHSQHHTFRPLFCFRFNWIGKNEKKIFLFSHFKQMHTHLRCVVDTIRLTSSYVFDVRMQFQMHKTTNLLISPRFGQNGKPKTKLNPISRHKQIHRRFCIAFFLCTVFVGSFDVVVDDDDDDRWQMHQMYWMFIYFLNFFICFSDGF